MTATQALITEQLNEAALTLSNFIANPAHIASVEEAAALMVAALQAGKKIISAGNGGSHCDAMHFAEELSGRYRDDRPAMAAIAISDPSHLSCVSNDYGFEFVFSRFVEGLGQQGDVFLGISTSGNSQNIIRAVEAARKKGMKTVILSGKNGGKLAGVADVEIRVPHFGYADRIQEIHIKIIHILIMLIEKGMAESK
jgi:D-sedoheptulose 7-phosphate isomerase